MGLDRGGLGLTGSSGSSGRVTTAFLAFSSLCRLFCRSFYHPNEPLKQREILLSDKQWPRRTDSCSAGSWLITSKSKDE